MKYMLNFFDNASKELHSEYEKLSQKDLELSDLDHYIESHTLKAYELAKVCRLRKTLREERREIKNTIDLLEIIKKYRPNKKFRKNKERSRSKVADININEYFRTNTGFIDKLNQYWLFNEKYKKLNIVNHSPNIIDLIEEGDYVNGRLIHKVDIRKNSSYIYYGNGKTFTDYQIETVVTKEQFQSVEYRLEE